MKNRMIKAGTYVPHLRVADPAYNAEEIIRGMRASKDCGLVVFPELCITGYTCADLFHQRILLEEAKKALISIRNESSTLPDTTYVVSLPLEYANNVYNGAAYINNGEVKGIALKSYIPTYNEFYEDRWFASGKDLKDQTVLLDGKEVPIGSDLLFVDEAVGACIGTEICEDAWVPDKPGTHMCLAGANILVNPSASNELIGKREYRTGLIVNHSADCYCGYVYCSAGPEESSTDLVFSGHCMITENGKLLKEQIYKNELLTGILDLDAIGHNRLHQNTFDTKEGNYRMISVTVKPLEGKETISALELSTVLAKEQYPINRMPFVPSDNAELKNRCHSILEIQANGLAKRVRATGLKNLVIGISGGLDSTLALLVCNEARKLVPEIHIIAITMPNKGNTTSQTYNNAMRLMKAVNCEIREIAIEEGVKQHLNAIGHGTAYKGEGDTTYENGQARMRTYILMDTANMENGLVVGTGDLSELALGWCTYNGDHMSMYGVNASVPKTLVQYICKAYALTTGNKELKQVLLDIIDTPISPELTPNQNGKIAQKTEEKIGKYDLNDFFLYYALRFGFEPSKVLSFAYVAYNEQDKGAIKEAAVRFYKRFFSQQFKRSCLPDGPKVGSISLSPRGDWRMPSDASVQLWLKDLENA